MTELNGTCDTLLPDFDVFQAIGGNGPKGKDVFVVGKAEPDISRLAYINCRYGVTSNSAPPAIEIGVSLYQTDVNASDRIAATVDDYTNNHGATSADTTVNGRSAMWLTGGTGAGYTNPTLVVAAGQRTVAVSIAGTVATGTKAKTDAIAIAKLALDRTAQ